ncbi:MAG: hypothetical protein WDN76_04185 [Alphaproteobacteria bacterium]
MAEAAKPKKADLKTVVASLRQPRVASMAALGFSSGLPFLLTGATFGYWLRDEGTTLTAIGFLSWVGLAYTFKFLWSPIVDRTPAPIFGRLGQRRGWAVFAQSLVAAGLIGMAFYGMQDAGIRASPDVATSATPSPLSAHSQTWLVAMGAFALVVAFASATQDIVVDAWRIESATDSDELGLLTSAFQLGYRAALLVTDALILIFAQHLGWPLSYVLMAVFMGVGLLASFRTPESKKNRSRGGRNVADARNGGSGARAQLSRGDHRLRCRCGVFGAIAGDKGRAGVCRPVGRRPGRRRRHVCAAADIQRRRRTVQRLPESPRRVGDPDAGDDQSLSLARISHRPRRGAVLFRSRAWQGCRRRRTRVGRTSGLRSRNRRWRTRDRPLRLHAKPHRRRSATGPWRRRLFAGGVGRRKSGYSLVRLRYGGGQFLLRVRRRRADHVHVEPDEHRLHSDAIRIPELSLHVVRQGAERLFRWSMV